MTHSMDMAPPALQKLFAGSSRHHGILGMWLFLAGDAAMFLILLLGYALMRYSIPNWPDPATVLDIPLALIMTACLVGSSAAVVKALKAIRSDRLDVMRNYLALAMLGGILFLVCQAYEWGHLSTLGVAVDSHPFGASQFSGMFYIITGFHGCHVLGGVIYLAVILYFTMQNRYTAQKHDGVTMVGLYWHFVDLMWVLIFLMLYLL